MNKFAKILSALLAVVMLLGSFVVGAGAIPLLDSEGEKLNASGNIAGIVDYEVTLDTYLEGSYNTEVGYIAPQTPQQKLERMTLMWEENGYEFWVEELTGEVATVKVSTGEILFSNPWNASTSTNKNGKDVDLSVKKELLSQLVVNYVDNNNAKTMYSCTDAASRGQINVEYIKNGIRVEYSIGRQETRMLVPMQISAERFETKILKVLRETLNEEFRITITKAELFDWPKATVGQEYGYYDLVKLHFPEFELDDPCDLLSEVGKKENYAVKKIGSFYNLQDPEKALTDSEKSAIEASFPITKKMPIYVLTPSISNRDKTAIENYIKSYVVSYTYEELDYDHELVGYVAADKSPPLFKMALEYSVDELGGISVRLPANGIRFDESLYQLNNIEMLPYMGAGENDGDATDGADGYTFFPDGSGALFSFDELSTVSGKVYGQDYAYHQITGTHQESIRYPVFGIVENWEGKKTVKTLVTPEVRDPETNEIIKEAVYSSKVVNTEEDRGFVAIIEEGDALAEIKCDQGGSRHMYNTVKMVFSPRPKDSYNMADAISVGSNTVMTVVSKRKYVGDYKVRYIMLSDDDLAFDNKLTSYYECSWMGMALAYRDYLEKTGVFSRLEADDVEDDIPIYIETFGALTTTEKFMSIPVDVMTPLTTFDDIKTMYSELSAEIVSSMKDVVANGQAIGINDTSAEKFSNINFKLTGYANGGMYSTVPYHLNWESVVGGASGFEELVELSKDEENGGFGIFPDFDFLYINTSDWFDGVSLRNDAVKTIDNRYTSRREYSATYQTYVGYFQYAITPSSIDRLVTKLTKNYLKYNPTGISMSTIGTDLNSDFNEDDPLNREDSKAYSVEALNKIASLKNDDGNALEIMVDGGNAYTWKYIDYIVNMPLNSSRYNNSINAVPFMGVVLHGFVQFAGTPINEEGDLESAMLKAIENGASIYFTLSYQNTQKLKDDIRLSEYFSVRYDIWKDDLVDMYVELNNLLADLQTKLIIDHEFLTGERVPDPDEELSDKEAAEKAEAEEKALAELKALKEALKAALNLRHTPNNSIAKIENALAEINTLAERFATNVGMIDIDFVTECAEIINYVKTLEEAVEDAKTGTYSVVAYKNVIDALSKKISTAIADGTLDEDVAKVYADAITGVTDTAKLDAIKNVVDNTKSELVNALTGAAAEEAFKQITSETVASNEVIAVIKTVVTDKITDLKNAANDSDKALVENVGKAISDAVNVMFTEEFAKNLTDTANSTYNSSVTSIDKLVTNYVKKATELQTAVDAAMAAGFTKENIETVITLQDAVSNAATENEQKLAAEALAAELGENKELLSTVAKAREAVNKEMKNLNDGEVKVDILLAAYAVKYDEKARDTSSHKNTVQIIYNAYSQILQQRDLAKDAYDQAAAAVVGLNERKDLMKEVAEEAHTEFRVYAIAYLATSFDAEQLEKLAEKIDDEEFEGDPKPEYLKAVEAADYANAIKVINTEIAELEAAYNNATGDAKAEAKTLLDAAIIASEKDEDDIVALYINVLDNYKAAKTDAVNAENFYKTAIEETATAKEKLDECEAKCEDIYKMFNIDVRQMKVDLIGKNNVSAKNTEALNFIKNINNYFATVDGAFAIIAEKQKEMETVAATVKTLKAEFDELKARRYDLTADERDRYDELEALLLENEGKLNELNTAIAEQFKIFQNEFRYLNTTIPYLADSISVIKDELDNAEKLLALIEAEGKDKTEIAATVAAFKNDFENLKAQYDEIVARYNKLGETALEYKMVSKRTETDEFYTVSYSYMLGTEVINEAFGRNVTVTVKPVTKYTCDDGSIVAVTYGGKNGDDSKAYRTFILNYNAFAVTVDYNGVSYKLDGYGYCVINH